MRAFLCIAIAVSGWAFGVLKALSVKNGFDAFCGIIDLLSYILRRMEYSRQTLSEIYKLYENGALEKCGFLTALKNGSDFENAAALLPAEMPLKTEIIGFGSDIGKNDYGEELMSLRGFIAELNSYKDENQSKISGKIKYYGYLGLLAGCAAAIILY